MILSVDYKLLSVLFKFVWNDFEEIKKKGMS